MYLVDTGLYYFYIALAICGWHFQLKKGIVK